MSKHLLSLLILLSGAVASATELQVEGLFSGSAVLKIDGKRRLLKSGQTSPEGVKVIRADSDKVIVEVDGQRRSLGLSTTIGSQFTPAERQSVSLSKGKGSRSGYQATGRINGYPVRMLVDTGATHIAMNSGEAERLGIDFQRKGKKGRLGTASGITEVWYLELDKVSVGNIEVRNVLASVSEGSFPTTILLGMSFLNHVRMEERDGLLKLTEK